MPRGLGEARGVWGHPVDQAGTQIPVKLRSGENGKARLLGEAEDGAKGTVQGPQALNHILHPRRGQPPSAGCHLPRPRPPPSCLGASTLPPQGC